MTQEKTTSEGLEDALSMFVTNPKGDSESSPEETTEETQKETKKETDVEPEGTVHAKKETEDRFDKHPRFRELNQQKREAQRIAREKEREAYELKSALNSMQEEIAALKQQPTKKINPFKEIGVDDEQYDEHLTTEREYLKSQLKRELLAELNAEREKELQLQRRNAEEAERIREEIEDEIVDYPELTKKEVELYIAENIQTYAKNGYVNVTKAVLDLSRTKIKEKVVSQKKSVSDVEVGKVNTSPKGYTSIIRRIR